MTRRPNAIHRDTGIGAGTNFLEVAGPTGTALTDDRIVSVTITRGNGNPVGLTGNTCTLEAKGWIESQPWAATADLAMSVRVSDAAADLIAARLGSTRDGVQDRFHGMAKSVTYIDTGEVSPPTSRAEGVDWMSLLPDIDQGSTVLDTNPGTAELYRNNWARANLPTPEITFWGAAWGTVVLPEGQTFRNVSTSDVWGKFCADLGHYVFTDRHGNPTAYASDHRPDQAASQPNFFPQELLRNHVLSPVHYSTDATTGTLVDYDYRKSDRTVATSWAPTPTGFVGQIEHLDLTHVYESPDLHSAAGYHRWRKRKNAPVLRTVTIDALALFRRGNPTDLAWLRQMLAFHGGEAFMIAGGWYHPGIYYLTRITEKIGRHQWLFTLDIVPSRYLADGALPQPDPYTWDTNRPSPDPTAYVYTWDAGGFPAWNEWSP